MRKQGLFTLALMLMLPFTVIAADATSAPPSVTMSGGDMVPKPPVCNASNQMLHWDGSAWQCIANPGVASLGKGAVVSVTTGSCPSGTTRHHINTYSEKYWCGMVRQCTRETPKYMCVKN